MIRETLIAIAVAVMVIFLAVSCGVFGGQMLCRDAGKVMGRPSRYEAAECFIQQPDGQWVPKDAVRYDGGQEK